MTARPLFATRLYQAELDDEPLLDELEHSIRTLANDDKAGRSWSQDHHYPGYTSYGSLNDLPKRDPSFGDLSKILSRHALSFASESAFDIGRKPRLDSLWVNLLKGSGHHSAHIHPHSMISGTLYVEVPQGSGSIRFEDPRLPLMMAAPKRLKDAPEEFQQFVSVSPKRGLLLLWESWLRHEVLGGNARSERLSISFNFA